MFPAFHNGAIVASGRIWPVHAKQSGTRPLEPRKLATEEPEMLRLPPKHDLTKLFGNAHPAWKVLALLADRSPWIAVAMLSVIHAEKLLK